MTRPLLQRKSSAEGLGIYIGPAVSLVQVGAVRVDLATGTDRAVQGGNSRAGIDIGQERLVSAFRQRHKDASPGRINVDEEIGVLGGCRGRVSLRTARAS